MPLGRFAFSCVEVADSPNSRKCKLHMEDRDKVGTYNGWRVYHLGVFRDQHTSSIAVDFGARIACFAEGIGSNRISAHDEYRRVAGFLAQGPPKCHCCDESMWSREIYDNSFFGDHLPREHWPAQGYRPTCKSGLLPMVLRPRMWQSPPCTLWKHSVG